jgi:hypothetical protein
MGTELGTVFSGGPSEYTALVASSPTIDATDWPCGPTTTCPTVSSGTGTLITAPVSAIEYFEVQFHLANNYWGINMNFGNSIPGGYLRQGIAHMLDKTVFTTSEANLIGAGVPIDNPLSPSIGGNLPGANPCSWDQNYTQTGSNCVVGAPGGTAYHLATATGADGYAWLQAPGSPDLNAAAAHFANAFQSEAGCSGVTYSTTTSILSIPSGCATTLQAHVPTFFVRSDDLSRLDLGDSLSAQICYIFTGVYTQPCAYLHVVPGPITAFPGFQTNPTGLNLNWWMYTAGYIGGTFFDSSLYFTYNSAFVDGAGSDTIASGGTCSNSAVPSSSAADYMYLCNENYDSISSQMEFAPCLTNTGDPTVGQTTPTFADCPSSTQLTAISAGYQAENLYGAGAYTIPIYTEKDQYGYLNNGWIRAINAPSFGLGQFFTWLNAYNPTPTQANTIRQGFAESTKSLSPYIESTVWDIDIVGNIYDSLYIANPLSPTQLMNWMTISTQPEPNSQLTYTPPGGFCTSTVSSVSTTLGSTTVTVVSGGFPGVIPGMAVTGTGIASGTTVVSVSGNTLTLSIAATATGTVTLTFTGTPGACTTTTYRFTLIPGLTFQDGSPVTAFDVAFSYLSLLGTGAFQSGGASPINGITILGQHQFDFNLKSSGPFTLTGITGLTVFPAKDWILTSSCLYPVSGTSCISSATYPAQYVLSSPTVSGVSTTSGSTTVTVASGDFPGVAAGMTVTGTGIASGTTVVSVSGNTLTLSVAATVTGTTTLTFGPVACGPAGCGTVPPSALTWDPNKITATYDPLKNGILVGSSAWQCGSGSGLGGPGCSSISAENPGPGGSYTLTANPGYVHSSSALALWVWASDGSAGGPTLGTYSTVAGCFNAISTPVGIDASSTGSGQGCSHWQDGIGAGNPTATVAAGTAGIALSTPSNLVFTGPTPFGAGDTIVDNVAGGTTYAASDIVIGCVATATCTPTTPAVGTTLNTSPLLKYYANPAITCTAGLWCNGDSVVFDTNSLGYYAWSAVTSSVNSNAAGLFITPSTGINIPPPPPATGTNAGACPPSGVAGVTSSGCWAYAGVTQVGIVALRINYNWLNPFNWVSSPPLGIGAFPPVLYQPNSNVPLNPDSVAACNNPFSTTSTTSGGYDC